MSNDFKNSVIENKRFILAEKKQRLNIMSLRNKFLGEWASSILGLNSNEKEFYIKNIIELDPENINSTVVLKKIAKDFKKKILIFHLRKFNLKLMIFI